MVLSNKKLKQKIPEDLVNSLFVTVAETNPDSVSNMQSLKEREKRRKFDTYTSEDKPNEVIEEGTKADEDKVKAEEIQVDTNNKEEDRVVPNKLYVEGIPYQTTEEEILSYFKSCGVITKVDCKMRPEDGACIAYITFETEDGANRGLAFDRAAMGDQYLTIQQYVETTTSIPTRRTSFLPETVEEGYNRVCIGNLAWDDTTERDIRKLFSGCVINSVRLGKNKETGKFNGCRHVDFKDSVSVAMAGDNRTPGETNNSEETYAAVPNEVNNGNYFATTVRRGKIKRRICYVCREKGHLSTACPKKLQDAAADHTNGKIKRRICYFATTVGSGKIKRRICYVCREKGHLSTACPKKLQDTAADHTNAKVDHQTVEARPIP